MFTKGFPPRSSMKIQLCLSQNINATPYTFKTGVRVFTFEEAMYYVFYHWRESVDEFLGDKIISWVAEIGHSYLAAKMKELVKKDNFSAKVLGFLRLAEYFAEDELDGLKGELEKWELRREWEQLKERGDYFARKKECEKAIPLYRRALQYDDGNVTILNNLAVQYMQVGATAEALSCLTRALSLEPKNFSILLHYVEAAILNGSFDKAAKSIKKAYAHQPDNADISYLLGLMSFEKKDYPAALMHFEKAMEADKTVAYYVFKAVDIHLQMRQYEKALDTLQKITARDTAYYAKEAEIYHAWGDVTRAIRSMSGALALTRDPEATQYARLASYHRQDYDMPMAEIAIKKALAISPENNIARLENARIKKGLGRTREYQTSLNEILKAFKENYRTD
ncbi:MAG: tetratricopeptide repeat protein [Defluviitaleaceae bacterium]|nr:tetratricopeptide repeat protein [Defluviitaleaceae bacterium]